MCGIGGFGLFWLIVLMLLMFVSFVKLLLINLDVGFHGFVDKLAPIIGRCTVDTVGTLLETIDSYKATERECLVHYVWYKFYHLTKLCVTCFTLCYSSEEVNEISLNLFHCYSNFFILT